MLIRYGNPQEGQFRQEFLEAAETIAEEFGQDLVILHREQVDYVMLSDGGKEAFEASVGIDPEGYLFKLGMKVIVNSCNIKNPAGKMESHTIIHLYDRGMSGEQPMKLFVQATPHALISLLYAGFY